MRQLIYAIFIASEHIVSLVAKKLVKHQRSQNIMTTVMAVTNSFLRNQKTFMNYLQKVNEGKLQQNNSSRNCADIVKICTKHCLHCVAVLS